MATVTSAFTATASTSNTNTYTTGSFTPTEDDLLVVFVSATATTDDGALTASANGLTFTLVDSAERTTATANTLYCFVADQLVPSSPSSMTLTFDCTGDDATGAIIMGAAVAGMSRVGLDAILQVALDENRVGGEANETVFSSSALTGNATLMGIGNGVTNGTSAPSGWTEREDTSHSTPAHGASLYSRNSGFTGTTITLGDSNNGGCCAISVELDTSSASTPVGQELEAVWDVRAAVGRSVQAVWDVRAAVGRSSQAVWNVATSVTRSVQAVWDVRAAVGQTRALVWDVRAAVASTSNYSWNVRSTVQQNLSLSWNVRALASRTLGLVWDVRAAVGQTVEAVWNVRTAVTRSVQAVWNVRATVGQSLEAVWDVLADGLFAGRDLALQYNVRANVGQNLSPVWNVRVLVTRSAQALWNVRERVGQVNTYSWNVRQLVRSKNLLSTARATFDSNSLDGLIPSRGTITTTTEDSYSGGRSLKYVVTDTSSSGYFVPPGTVPNWYPVKPDTQYTVVGMVKAGASTSATAFTGMYWYTAAGTFISSVNGAVSTPTTAWSQRTATLTSPPDAAYIRPLWYMGGTRSLSETFFWDELGVWEGASTTWVAPGPALSSRWKVRAAVAQTLQPVWNVRALASRTLSASWNIRAAATRSVVTRWRVLTTVAQTLSSSWNVRALAGQAVSAAWHVRASIGQSLSSLWNVLGLNIGLPWIRFGSDGDGASRDESTHGAASRDESGAAMASRDEADSTTTRFGG